MGRIYVVCETLGVAPHIVAEFHETEADTITRAPVRVEEARDKYPEAVEAWARGDDSLAEECERRAAVESAVSGADLSIRRGDFEEGMELLREVVG